eukprot:c20445_g1_i4.p7 GENE.c20445_g1_i4~~c20445_g1_i4.p7  ORF type:complete len:109 (+),score=14.06 c20445_g1_i4:102-428(+)
MPSRLQGCHSGFLTNMLGQKRIRSQLSPEPVVGETEPATKRSRPLVESKEVAASETSSPSDDEFEAFNALVAALWKQPLAALESRCVEFDIPTTSRQSMVLVLVGFIS